MAIQRGIVFGCALLLMASGAAAQVLQPPARPSRGLFGGGPPPDPRRTHHELVLNASLLGGHDDNLAPPGFGDGLGSYPSGYIGFGDTAVRHFFGNDTRSIETTGRAYMNTFRNVGLGPSYGGDQTLNARTALGRRSGVTFTESVGYAPYFSLGLFGGPLEDVGGDDRENGPTNALAKGGSWATRFAVALDHQWTRSSSLQASYAFGQQTYVEGDSFDSRTSNASVGFSHSIGRWAGIRAGYQQTDSNYEQSESGDNDTTPLNTKTLDGGFSYQRRLSLTRQLAFSAGGGAIYTETTGLLTMRPVNYWVPSGYGTFRMDVGRSWSLSADYRRTVSVLQGISPEAFASHAGQLSLGGVPRRWLEAVLTGGFSNGASGQQVLGKSPGTYVGYTMTGQLRFQLAPTLSSVVSYTHFQYSMSEAASQMLGVLRDLQRNAVRVGFAWTLPLYGSSAR